MLDKSAASGSKNNNMLNTNVDFFSTQLFDFKSSAAKKRLLPHLIQGFKTIESQMTNIKTSLSKAIKDLDDSIDKGEKRKNNNNGNEFAGENVNANDVFIYGNNGEGYYMSNQKIMKEATILNSMKSENIFKHKKFFCKRFDLIDRDKETFIENGLSRGTEKKFKIIEEYLDQTEDMKKRAIKHIEMHQMKMRMEVLNENSSEEDSGNELDADEPAAVVQ